VFLRRTCGDGPAAVGALLFAASGFMLSHGVHMNMVAVVAHVPWLLVLADRVLESRSPRGRARAGAGAALATGSAILWGHPQAVWFALLIVGSYVAMRVVAVRRQAGPALMVAGAGALLGLAMGAPQIVATVQMVRQSARPVSDAAFADTFALPLVQALQLVQPYGFWGRVLRWNEVASAADEFAVYAGAVPLVLAAWWLQSGRGRERAGSPTLHRLSWWAFGLACAGLWLALGRRAGLYALQSWLPFVSQFRAPVRFTLFTHLGLAVLASAALWHLWQLRSAAGPRGARRITIAPWLLAAASVTVAVWMGSAPGRVPPSTPWWVLAAGPAAFLAAALLVTMAEAGVRLALPALVLLAALDQGVYGLGGVIAWQDFVTRSEAEALLDTRGLDVPTTEGRIARGGFPDLYVLAGYRLLNGYAGLTPVRQLDYRQANALRVAGVAFAHRDFLNGADVAGAEPVGRGWLRLTAPLPRARLVGDVRQSTAAARDLATIDVTRTAIVEEPVAVDPGTEGSVRVTGDSPGLMETITEAPGRRLLVTTESFAVGWIATVDGFPVDVRRVNGDFLGVELPAGRHTVVLEYQLPGLAVWGGVGVGGLVLTLLLGGFPLLRRRRASACRSA
jgi:hypothetical protein